MQCGIAQQPAGHKVVTIFEEFHQTWVYQVDA